MKVKEKKKYLTMNQFRIMRREGGKESGKLWLFASLFDLNDKITLKILEEYSVIVGYFYYVAFYYFML